MFSLKVNHFLLLILLLSILSLRCSESTEPNSENLDLIPMTIGNKWNDKLTSYDSLGNVLYTENISSSIDKDTIIDGTIWYGYADGFSGIWNINKTNGYWTFVKAYYGYSLNDTTWMVYKYPCNVGETYGEAEYPIQVVSTNENISVPAGNFTTIRYSFNFVNYNNYLLISNEVYVCPGIGVVKSTQIGKKFDGSKYVVGKSELTSYNIKRN
jgi:hypothetical protein